MYIHKTIASTTANGPGNRCAIWLAGCTLACPGCFNSASHPHGSGQEILTNELARWVSGIEDIEGVTFSGGEPLQQGPDLSRLLWLIRRQRPELSIGMFTGYRPAELEDGKFSWYDPEEGRMQPGNSHIWADIQESLDFAIMGRYNQKLRTAAQPMCASRNQKIHLFSSFYKLEDFGSQTVEVVISPDAKLVSITGFPPNPAAFKELGCADACGVL